MPRHPAPHALMSLLLDVQEVLELAGEVAVVLVVRPVVAVGVEDEPCVQVCSKTRGRYVLFAVGGSWSDRALSTDEDQQAVCDEGGDGCQDREPHPSECLHRVSVLCRRKVRVRRNAVRA